MYYQAVKDKTKVMYIIQGERGGVVPKELQGRFTKKQFADDAIRAYEKGKENANVQKSTSKRSGRGSGTTRKKELSGSRSED